MNRVIGLLAAMATCVLTSACSVETLEPDEATSEAAEALVLFCYDANPCTSDAPTSGYAGNYCGYPPLADGTWCGRGATCEDGACCGPVGDNGPCQADADCNDGNECTQDICVDGTGTCAHHLANNNTTCNGDAGRCDGNGCCCSGCFERNPDSGGYECVPRCSSGNKCDLPNGMCEEPPPVKAAHVETMLANPCNDHNVCTNDKLISGPAGTRCYHSWNDGFLCGGSANNDVHGECVGGSCSWTNWTCVHGGAGAACNGGVDRCTADGVCCAGCINSSGLCLDIECHGMLHGQACPSDACAVSDNDAPSLRPSLGDSSGVVFCYDGNPCTTDKTISGVAGNYCAYPRLPNGTGCGTQASCHDGNCLCQNDGAECNTSNDCFLTQCGESECVLGRCRSYARAAGTLCFTDGGTVGTCNGCSCVTE